MDSQPSFGRVARLALWLGVAGFGGGYAVLAQIGRTVTRRWGWIDEGEYADIVAVAQSLPGATAANAFAQLGFRVAGVRGAVVMTALFLLPSAALMVLFAALYEHLRGAREIEAIFAGMNPAVVAVVASVAWGLAKRMRRPWQVALVAGALGALEIGVGVFEVVLLAAIGATVFGRVRSRVAARQPPPLALAPMSLLLPKLAILFLRLGAVSFGGGLALIPILDHQIVEALGWLTPREFSDAVTLGQITPGPVAITATFVGYRVAGMVGALVATVGTFAPPLAATIVASRSIAVFRSTPMVTEVMEALAPVTVAIVIAAALSLARSSLLGGVDYAVAAGSLVVLLTLRVPALAVLVAAAAMRALTLFAR